LIGFAFGLHLGIASDVTDAFLQLATHVLGEPATRSLSAMVVSCS
jgi:hypothetical protein